MTLIDTLFNWLQLKLVYDFRPHDEAAKTSLDHIANILKEVYQVHAVTAVKEEQKPFYLVSYCLDGKEQSQLFPAEAAETLLQFILQNPERFDFPS